ncbi:MAG: putative peptidoglycan glycosyltransferase FtsW [Gemmatimonadales bacterium]|nr:putative peptidoglycan glycosyltransferase FtsW [Gemmatimonadales bacterium]
MAAPPVRHPADVVWEVRLLAVVTAVLVVFGLATTYGASSLEPTRTGTIGAAFFLRQGVGALAGGVLLLACARLDYQRWRPLAWPLLGLTVVLLVALLLPLPRTIVVAEHGARRWLRLGPVQLQPSELAKLTFVIWCAMLAAKKGDQVRDFKRGTLPFLLMMGIVAGLVLKQPNLSMATVIALLGGLVLFGAGAKIGHFVVLAVCGLLGVYQLIRGREYRLKRLLAFLDPDSNPDTALQLKQSLIGIGSGGLQGVGFGEGQLKLGHLPFAYSDFLFSTIGEEWGFLGVCLVVGLYAVFCWLGFRIARTAPDPFGQFLALGLTAAVGITAFLHMAVTLGLMPTTGLTLPFMSYGRSSLVISLAGTGILMSVGRARGRPARG